MPRFRDPVRRSTDGEVQRLVRSGPTHVGRGVFAKRRIAAGSVIGEILGDVCDEHPADPSYCMELPSGRVLEPTAPFRFLNHSCDPNCELFYWCDEDDRASQEDRLWLQTIRDVEAGEELLIDYCWPADAAIPCRCGAPNCRGWIVDPDEWHLIPAPTTPREPHPLGQPEAGQVEMGATPDGPRTGSDPGAAPRGGLPPSPPS